MQSQRHSGILLHPTSLPGPFSIGTLGSECYKFIDFLVAAGQSVWQILPLGPTGYGDSPYSSYSAFAGNPLLICPERLVEAGDLSACDLQLFQEDFTRVDFAVANRVQQKLLAKASEHFFHQGAPERQQAFETFCLAQSHWLDDYAIFRAIRTRLGEIPWSDWPAELRQRDAGALEIWRRQLETEIRCQKYCQFVFFNQWLNIKNYANRNRIKILGDIPIFVALDSSDVWAHQELFKLGSSGTPQVVAGVPPDYFSATGQRWGNPLYDWEQMTATGFSWWIQRLQWNLEMTDLLRIDHFRGFAACWEIPAQELTAINGTWRPVPGAELFATLEKALGSLPLIAEDLGLITEDVDQLRRQFGLPGMKVLQFAFDSGPDNPYLPANIEEHSVVYTGTHDNNTTLGWWQALAPEQKRHVRAVLGPGRTKMPWGLIEAALQSRAELCILPLQDVLSLPATARMNTPGRATDNWSWRYKADALQQELALRLLELTRRYGRV